MNATRDPRGPRLYEEGGRLYVEVGRDDAEELQIHLSSLGVRTAWDGAPHQATRLVVLDHGRQDVEAMLGEWEVARA